MTKEQCEINDFMERCFYLILAKERTHMEAGVDLTLREIHVIDAVDRAQATAQNNFSNIASKIGVTLGTLTTAFSKLERKGYLRKEQKLIDHRVFYITPTPKAKPILEKHSAWHRALVESISKAVSPADLGGFMAGLQSIEKHILSLD